MAAVEVGEPLLVGGLAAVVELLGRPARGSRRPCSVGSSPPKPWRSRAPSSSVLARSASIASPTPGYCTLTATARSSPVVGVDGDGAVDLADRRRGDRLRVPLDEHPLGGGAELALDDLGGQLGRHRRRRRPAAGPAPGAPARAGRRRGSWPSGRPSSARPSCCRAARRPARRVRSRARSSSSARRSAEANTLRAFEAASVPPTATPRRASSRLRPARVVRLIGPARRVRRNDGRSPATSGDGGADDRRATATAHDATARQASTSTGHGAVRAGDDGVVAGVDPERAGAGDRLEQLDLAAQRHDLVLHRHDARTSGRRCRPATRRSGTSRSPRRPRGSSATRGDAASSIAHGDHVSVLRCRYSWWVSQARAWDGVTRASRLRLRSPRNDEAVVVAGVEPRRRRRQHEAAHGVGMAPPEQLGDGAAHRVADGDRRSGVLDGEQLGDVVGAVLEPERDAGCGARCRGRGGRRRAPGSARRGARSSCRS